MWAAADPRNETISYLPYPNPILSTPFPSPPSISPHLPSPPLTLPTPYSYTASSPAHATLPLHSTCPSPHTSPAFRSTYPLLPTIPHHSLPLQSFPSARPLPTHAPSTLTLSTLPPLFHSLSTPSPPPPPDHSRVVSPDSWVVKLCPVKACNSGVGVINCVSPQVEWSV